jgi:glycosyltransferase involved in cell wall biosynthesis
VNASLIICTRNRASDLARTLENILPLIHDEAVLQEILVVDNGSSDGTRDLVEKTRASWSKLRYTLCPDHGLSKARNHGIKVTRGEIIVWTDDDVRITQYWLSSLLRPILSGESEAAVGRVEIPNHLSRKWMSAGHRPWLAENIRPVPARLIGANMAISRRSLLAAGGFDPKLGAGALGFHEETSLGRHLRAMGISVVYVDEALIIHHFQEERLFRVSWIRTARNAGRSTAHLCHFSDGRKEKHILSRLCWHQFRLLMWRLTHLSLIRQGEGLDLREFSMIKTISYLEHMYRITLPSSFFIHGHGEKSFRCPRS